MLRDLHPTPKQVIGPELGDIPVNGCMTKAPCGGEKAGPSPVDRRKGGLKRSTASDGYGIPLALVSAGAHRHDSPLLAPTLAAALAQAGPMPGDVTAHLDAAYDSVIARLGARAQARFQVPAPGRVVPSRARFRTAPGRASQAAAGSPI